jgi:ribose-phosphate pyrophosphokinase
MITAPPIPVKVDEVVVVGNVSENPSAMDTAHFFGQKVDVSDVISLKTFENSEFCPRFIATPDDSKVGYGLEGKGVVIASSSIQSHTRNEVAMRNLMVARAAKDNGAAWVVLVEPDLFYSAQDRGPRLGQGSRGDVRSDSDRHKFNGQPFSALMYAQMLKLAGVDEVMTVHNHSDSVRAVFEDIFEGHFTDLSPHRLYARYVEESRITTPGETILVAPDQGALDFVLKTKEAMGLKDEGHVLMSKVRSGERKVSMAVSSNSPLPLEAVEGKDLIVMDDMVRTGGTIIRCCELLRQYRPRRIVFLVTHFHSSKEGRLNLAHPSLDEIITTNTIPSILNRDTQGRLRTKMAVLKTSRWIAHHLRRRFGLETGDLKGKWYQEDMSSRNPRSGFSY